MQGYRDKLSFQYFDQFEATLCLTINRYRPRWLRTCLCALSKAGNGPIWYVLMMVLPLIHGVAAVPTVLRMLFTGVVGIWLYRQIKAKTSRMRPYRTHSEIEIMTAPLDQFSFPSGHTLHAVAFTTVIIAVFPGWGWLLLPFTGLTAVSRVALGLHYPSDVLVGGLLGLLLGLVSLTLG